MDHFILDTICHVKLISFSGHRKSENKIQSKSSQHRNEKKMCMQQDGCEVKCGEDGVRTNYKRNIYWTVMTSGLKWVCERERERHTVCVCDSITLLTSRLSIRSPSSAVQFRMRNGCKFIVISVLISHAHTHIHSGCSSFVCWWPTLWIFVCDIFIWYGSFFFLNHFFFFFFCERRRHYRCRRHRLCWCCYCCYYWSCRLLSLCHFAEFSYIKPHRLRIFPVNVWMRVCVCV